MNSILGFSKWVQRNGNFVPQVRILLLFITFTSMGAYLYWQGQPLICECGYIKLWENEIISSGNSQHIADWYTPSHFLFGILIGLAWKILFPKMPLRYAFLVSAIAAVTWEIAEHTDYVLERFREATISLGYYGDSVLNSMADAIFQAIGFYAATRLRVQHIIVVILVLEILAATYARDSLILSTLMLIHPVDSIKTWQMNR